MRTREATEDIYLPISEFKANVPPQGERGVYATLQPQHKKLSFCYMFYNFANWVHVFVAALLNVVMSLIYNQIIILVVYLPTNPNCSNLGNKGSNPGCSETGAASK